MTKPLQISPRGTFPLLVNFFNLAFKKQDKISYAQSNLLTEEEANFYSLLKLLKSGNRLKQEKISQLYADSILTALF